MRRSATSVCNVMGTNYQLEVKLLFDVSTTRFCQGVYTYFITKDLGK